MYLNREASYLNKEEDYSYDIYPSIDLKLSMLCYDNCGNGIIPDCYREPQEVFKELPYDITNFSTGFNPFGLSRFSEIQYTHDSAYNTDATVVGYVTYISGFDSNDEEFFLKFNCYEDEKINTFEFKKSSYDVASSGQSLAELAAALIFFKCF